MLQEALAFPLAFRVARPPHPCPSPLRREGKPVIGCAAVARPMRNVLHTLHNPFPEETHMAHEDLKQTLIMAGKVLVAEGQDDFTRGHISMRVPGDPGKFYMKADRKSTRLNSSHIPLSRMPSSA